MFRYFAAGMLLLAISTTALAQSLPRRTARVAPRPTVDPTLKALNTIIPTAEYTEQPLESVIEALGEYTKANIQVRWQKVEDSGVPRDKPISLKVSNVPLSMVLWLVMSEAGGGEVKLAYRATSNAGGTLIILSTDDDLGAEMVTKVYDVTDLLVNVPRFDNAPRIDPSQALQGVSSSGGGGLGGSGGSSGGGNIFSDQGEEDQEENQNGVNAPGMEELIRLIVDTIEPDSWVQNGGRGTITPFRYQIVVRNSLIVHQRLNGYKIRED